MIELRIFEATRVDSPRLTRVACKAVVRGGEKLLLLRSTNMGAYKYPGGGCEPGETHADALTRELAAECGRPVHAVGAVVAKVIELRDAVEPGAVFEMTSIYYDVIVGEDSGERELESYEAALGLAPCWVTAVEALSTNRELLARARQPRWVGRETLVLESIETSETVGGIRQ